jgi:methylmalonyl-CoA mutase
VTDPAVSDFPAVSVEQWRSAVRAKAGAEAPLASVLEDGIEARWLYTAQDESDGDLGQRPGMTSFVRSGRAGEPVAIRQHNGARTRAQANAQILEDLEGGATEVALAIDPSGERGIPVGTVDELDEVLGGVYLELAPIALVADQHAAAAARLLATLWERRGGQADQIRGSLGLDPIGALARDGATETQYRQAIQALIPAFSDLAPRFARVQVIAVDTTSYVDAGAGATDELAVALATAIAYLRECDQAGLGLSEIPARREFRLATGPDQFLEIAKLRAMRRLWATVLGHCGLALAQRRSRTYARTSRRMVSTLDPWINLLRGTTAAFAAAVGGADGITVLPFDEALGEAGPLGRRMARNTPLLLAEEASLGRVGDPAGGSWYVEALTDQLARRAWSELQAIERNGGIVGWLVDGMIAQRLALATERRRDQVSRRTRQLTGVNAFPLLDDDGLDRAGRPVSQRDDTRQPGGLPPARDAAAFEGLRARARALMEESRPPAILLACLGPLAAHVSVATWAKGFFEAGGIATVASGPMSDAADHCALLTERGLGAAVLCPGRYEPVDAQAQLVRALREAGADVVYLAGTRDDAAAARIGADRAVADGVDMVAILGELLDRVDDRERTA